MFQVGRDALKEMLKFTPAVSTVLVNTLTNHILRFQIDHISHSY